MSLRALQLRLHGNLDLPLCPGRPPPDRPPAAPRVKQRTWDARRLTAAQYIHTWGLGSCTAFILIDPIANVVGLAHFDGFETAYDINAMFAQMIHLGASAVDIECVFAGADTFNNTATTVHNDLLDSNYPNTPVTVFETGGEVAVFGDGSVYRIYRL
jgi:hypothetical protein